MEYYSGIKRNTFESAQMRRMNLQPITQGSKSERERQTPRMNAYSWNLEDSTDDPTGVVAKETDILRHSGGRRGSDDMRKQHGNIHHHM